MSKNKSKFKKTILFLSVISVASISSTIITACAKKEIEETPQTTQDTKYFHLYSELDGRQAKYADWYIGAENLIFSKTKKTDEYDVRVYRPIINFYKSLDDFLKKEDFYLHFVPEDEHKTKLMNFLNNVDFSRYNLLVFYKNIEHFSWTTDHIAGDGPYFSNINQEGNKIKLAIDSKRQKDIIQKPNTERKRVKTADFKLPKYEYNLFLLIDKQDIDYNQYVIEVIQADPKREVHLLSNDPIIVEYEQLEEK